ncbi:hypothetical protein Tco_1516204 [Tanacetum coccineum]
MRIGAYASLRDGVVAYWRHSDSCVVDDLPTAFDQGHVDRLSAHVIKLRTIPEGVLAQFGISKVWRNALCDPVIRHRDGTAVMSIYDFIRMPSLDGAKVREKPHNLCVPFLERVADHTTAPVPSGTAIPTATLEEIVVTQPDRGVVTKAKNIWNQDTPAIAASPANELDTGKQSKKEDSFLSTAAYLPLLLVIRFCSSLFIPAPHPRFLPSSFFPAIAASPANELDTGKQSKKKDTSAMAANSVGEILRDLRRVQTNVGVDVDLRRREMDASMH